MLKKTIYRSKEKELMDNFEMEGEHLAHALDKIAWINQTLGGNKITSKPFLKIVKVVPEGETVTITDMGCGNGDMLRSLAGIGKREKMHFRMTGIDANSFTINYARSLSEHYSEISYTCCDIVAPDFKPVESDIVLLTLTLHHFDDNQILCLLNKIKGSTKLAIIINDLQRTWLSYLLFGWMSKLFRFGNLNHEDGKLSILRGFKRKELEFFARKMNFKKYTIRWKWAFRYQWIITDL